MPLFFWRIDFFLGWGVTQGDLQLLYAAGA